MKKYLFKKRVLFFLHSLLILISVVLDVTIAFVLKYVLDAATAQDKQGLILAIFICIGFAVAYSVVKITEGMVKTKYMKDTMSAIKNDIFNSVMRYDIVKFSSTNSASHISMLNNDVAMVEENYIRNYWETYENVLLLSLSLVSMLLISPIIAGVAVVLSLFPILIPSILGAKLGDLQEKYSGKLAIYTEKIKDLFGGFEVLKGFGAENKAVQNHAFANEQVEQSKFKLNRKKIVVNTVAGVIAISVQSALFILSGFFVINGHLSVGAIVAVTQLSGGIVMPLMVLSGCMAKSKAIKSVNENIISLISETEHILPDNGKASFDGDIEYKDVTFSYDDENNVLKDVNLTIQKGKKYAIVGGSGSGKSTILRLLLGYYNNYSGDITVGGLSAKALPQGNIFDFCSIIHQSVFLFDDTIKQNITLFNDYPAETVDKAIKQSGLTELVAQAESGLDTMTGESGNRFSGGEKQRIAIARALVKGSELLVMDEATASLDNEIAYNIEKSLLDLKDLTCIVVTHRYNKELLKMYDKIFVFKNGGLHESGTFDELIDKNDYFFSLYNIAN